MFWSLWILYYGEVLSFSFVVLEPPWSTRDDLELTCCVLLCLFILKFDRSRASLQNFFSLIYWWVLWFLTQGCVHVRPVYFYIMQLYITTMATGWDRLWNVLYFSATPTPMKTRYSLVQYICIFCHIVNKVFSVKKGYFTVPFCWQCHTEAKCLEETCDFVIINWCV